MLDDSGGEDKNHSRRVVKPKGIAWPPNVDREERKFHKFGNRANELRSFVIENQELLHLYGSHPLTSIERELNSTREEIISQRVLEGYSIYRVCSLAELDRKEVWKEIQKNSKLKKACKLMGESKYLWSFIYQAVRQEPEILNWYHSCDPMLDIQDELMAIQKEIIVQRILEDKKLSEVRYLAQFPVDRHRLYQEIMENPLLVEYRKDIRTPFDLPSRRVLARLWKHGKSMDYDQIAEYFHLPWIKVFHELRLNSAKDMVTYIPEDAQRRADERAKRNTRKRAERTSETTIVEY